LAHKKILALDTKKQLRGLLRDTKTRPNKPESVIIRETWRMYDRERKLPNAFIQELAELTSHAQTIWADARAKSDFSLFQPSLKRLVELKRQEAEYVGYKDSPYDALLDAHEPGLTSASVSEVFNELRDFLKPFVRSLERSSQVFPSEKILHGTFPIADQQKFNQWVAEKMGFDFDAGRLDQSTHPFTTGFHPEDVRITTRYREHDLFYSLGSTIHEAGHALYEQGLPVKHYGTPLAESISYGIHESQSRIWENNVGKSKAFWTSLYPKLQKQFPKPFAKIPLETVYRIMNRVKPSLIRTEADEVTYNLHIILRYEIERELIEGTLKVKDLPEIWNAKIKKYLGLKVPNDREGVLQDVHWSGGSFGYFPTYTLGNLYAAQFYQTAHKKLPRLEADLKKGNFAPFREWLRTNIHAHGKTYSSDALVKEVCGEPLQAKYFIQYLKEKYLDLYKLSS
jgi:carboxypeptidase Taq